MSKTYVYHELINLTCGDSKKALALTNCYYNKIYYNCKYSSGIETIINKFIN